MLLTSAARVGCDTSKLIAASQAVAQRIAGGGLAGVIGQRFFSIG